jgi:hypothetical protein
MTMSTTRLDERESVFVARHSGDLIGNRRHSLE